MLEFFGKLKCDQEVAARNMTDIVVGEGTGDVPETPNTELQEKFEERQREKGTGLIKWQKAFEESQRIKDEAYATKD